MLAKFCSRSQGQPVTGVRSAAITSIRPKISREGFMSFPGSWICSSYAVSRPAIPAKPAHWPVDRGMLEHDPEKWEPVFGKDHAQAKEKSAMTNRRAVIAV